MRRTTFALLVLISICLAGASQAQERPFESSSIDLKFKGGTVGQYVDALRKTSGGANIVVMPDVADVLLGPIELKQADFYASVMLLDDHEHSTASRITHLKVEQQPSITEAGQDIFVVTGIIRDLVKEQPAVSRVFIVSQLLNADPPIPAEDVLSAVEAAMELTKGILPAADIFFHKETSLIIARGHPEQMNTIDSVVGQLWEGIRWREQQAMQEDTKYEAEVKRLQRTLNAATMENQRVKTEMQQEISLLQTRLASRERKIESLQEQIEELKKQ